MTHFSRALSLAALDALPDFDEFDSGLASVDVWPRESAIEAERRGSARTFLVLDGDGRLAGYYCLSMSGIARVSAPKRLGTNMPRQIPAVLIGRLARHIRHEGAGLGGALMQDAMVRAIAAARSVGAAAILVDTDPGATAFYEAYGFRATRSESQLYITMADVEATLSQMTREP